MKKENTAPNRPRKKPSTKNGKRIKLLVAPTIFIMPISSLRSSMARRIVLEMMIRETISRTAAMAMEAIYSTVRIVASAFPTSISA